MSIFKQNIRVTNNNMIVKALDTLYEKRIDLDPLTYLYAIKYVYQFTDTTHPYYHRVQTLYPYRILTQLLTELFQYPSIVSDRTVFNEYIDIFYSINRTEVQRLLDIYEHPPTIYQRQRTKKVRKTIYENKQNVHDKTIHTSVSNAAMYLFQHYYPTSKEDIFWKDEFLTFYEDASELISLLDQPFVYGNDNPYTLHDILNALFYYTSKELSTDKLFFFQRLYDELKDIQKTKCCTTGKLSRIINSIQGLQIHKELCIQMSLKERYYAIIQYYLNQCLQRASEEIQEGMVDKSDIYKAFIKTKIDQIKNQWIQEHGMEILPYIDTCIKEYYN